MRRLFGRFHAPALTALLLCCASLLSCGGGGNSSSLLSLTVTPSSASIMTNYETNSYTYVNLTAMLSNGTAPPVVNWSTTNKCVAVGTTTTNIMQVVCNFTCPPATITSTIRATTPNDLSASSSVTCTWY